MKKLNLNKCKTNEEVCRLISKRVGESSYEDLLEIHKEELLKIHKEELVKITGLYIRNTSSS